MASLELNLSETHMRHLVSEAHNHIAILRTMRDMSRTTAEERAGYNSRISLLQEAIFPIQQFVGVMWGDTYPDSRGPPRT